MLLCQCDGFVTAKPASHFTQPKDCRRFCALALLFCIYKQALTLNSGAAKHFPFAHSCLVSQPPPTYTTQDTLTLLLHTARIKK